MHSFKPWILLIAVLAVSTELVPALISISKTRQISHEINPVKISSTERISLINLQYSNVKKIIRDISEFQNPTYWNIVIHNISQRYGLDMLNNFQTLISDKVPVVTSISKYDLVQSISKSSSFRFRVNKLNKLNINYKLFPRHVFCQIHNLYVLPKNKNSFSTLLDKIRSNVVSPCSPFNNWHLFVVLNLLYQEEGQIEDMYKVPRNLKVVLRNAFLFRTDIEVHHLFGLIRHKWVEISWKDESSLVQIYKNSQKNFKHEMITTLSAYPMVPKYRKEHSRSIVRTSTIEHPGMRIGHTIIHYVNGSGKIGMRIVTKIDEKTGEKAITKIPIIAGSKRSINF